jgi:beta-glucosidase
MVYGDYPPVMRKNVGARLPAFSDEERKRVKGSFDFVGFNHYVVVYVKADLSRLDQRLRDYMGDAAVAYASKNLCDLDFFSRIRNSECNGECINLVHFFSAIPEVK